MPSNHKKKLFDYFWPIASGLLLGSSWLFIHLLVGFSAFFTGGASFYLYPIFIGLNVAAISLGLKPQLEEQLNRFYQWVCDKIGGRSKARAAGNLSRQLRLLALVPVLIASIILLVTAGPSVFLSVSKIPWWFWATNYLGIAVNSYAMIKGWGGNHGTVSLERRECAHANSALNHICKVEADSAKIAENVRTPRQKGEQSIPHGLDDGMRLSTVSRRAHDANSAFGSTMSAIMTLTKLGLYVIAAPWIQLASWFSRALSATFSNVTHSVRQSSYQEIALELYAEYGKKKSEQQLTAKELLPEVTDEKQLPLEERRLIAATRFRVAEVFTQFQHLFGAEFLKEKTKYKAENTQLKQYSIHDVLKMRVQRKLSQFSELSEVHQKNGGTFTTRIVRRGQLRCVDNIEHLQNSGFPRAKNNYAADSKQGNGSRGKDQEVDYLDGLSVFQKKCTKSALKKISKHLLGEGHGSAAFLQLAKKILSELNMNIDTEHDDFHKTLHIDIALAIAAAYAQNTQKPATKKIGFFAQQKNSPLPVAEAIKPVLNSLFIKGKDGYYRLNRARLPEKYRTPSHHHDHHEYVPNFIRTQLIQHIKDAVLAVEFPDKVRLNPNPVTTKTTPPVIVIDPEPVPTVSIAQSTQSFLTPKKPGKISIPDGDKFPESPCQKCPETPDNNTFTFEGQY